MVTRSLLMVVAFGSFCIIRAQTTDASCLPFYQWMANSHKKSPCEVASALLGICADSYNVAALPPNTHYLGPTLKLANPCQCNTVAYSLMSACGSCQGRTFDSWSTWSANCASVSVNSFPEPIPTSVYVPGWAYLDVKTNDTFNELLAKQNANTTESTFIPPPTSTSTKPTILLLLSKTLQIRRVTRAQMPSSEALSGVWWDYPY
ncbi:hypothetical protein BDZ94DRAFT_1243953 [Collybia nuda]|uniref:Secreted protein n=1 Tax=Collybia nuda TaxID=64659 RepID=A0A9P6CK51_9AGAR|nr:hypothetical protein BDZ94DRAFT_1243953 [Collybia nuda]